MAKVKAPTVTKVGNKVTVKNSTGSRLLNSVKAIFIGLAVAIICLIALTCNEIRSVKAIRAYDEFGKNLIETGSAKVDSSNDGRLVAIRGSLTFSPVSDPSYRITADSFALERKVEMYQYQERKEGSSTDAETVYTYDEVWSSSPINSSRFQDPSFANKPWPSDAAFQNVSVYSDDAKLGDFRVTPEQLARLPVDTALAVPEGVALPAGFSRSSDRRYIHSGNISAPKIGDLRISFFSSSVTRASMLGRQQGSAIVSYTAKNGTKIDRMFPGERSGAEMVEQLQAENTATTWFLRILLTVLVCIGFSMLLTPVQTLVSLIPAIGKFLGKATKKVAQVLGAIIGVILSLLVIAISWIAVRPFVGIPLLVVIVGLIILLVRYKKSKVDNAPATADTATAGTANGWTCECGRTGNIGKFCADCGKPQPAPVVSSTWDCECGHKGNTGKFCADCGKPQPAPVSATWDCECGHKENTGKFCASCGKPRP